MDQRITLITLGVSDLAAARRFYLDGLGWKPAPGGNDDVTFMRTDREFNSLQAAATHNEFALGAMALMHGLSRRFWYIHYKQAADMPLTAQLHADIARAIADADETGAAEATDRLLDAIERFTRDSVDADA